MWLLVGLGNPGAEYVHTRHNMGFQAVDKIVHRFSFMPFKPAFRGQMATGEIEGEKCLVLKPETYMNLSGESVQSAMAYYKIKPENVIVFHDDLDLPVGKIKAKVGGGAGGHNGLKNIDAHIGVNYMRVRIGIDKNKLINTADYVLGKPAPQDQKILESEFEKIAEFVPFLLKKDISGFLNKVHD